MKKRNILMAMALCFMTHSLIGMEQYKSVKAFEKELNQKFAQQPNEESDLTKIQQHLLKEKKLEEALLLQKQLDDEKKQYKIKLSTMGEEERKKFEAQKAEEEKQRIEELKEKCQKEFDAAKNNLKEQLGEMSKYKFFEKELGQEIDIPLAELNKAIQIQEEFKTALIAVLSETGEKINCGRFEKFVKAIEEQKTIQDFILKREEATKIFDMIDNIKTNYMQASKNYYAKIKELQQAKQVLQKAEQTYEQIKKTLEQANAYADQLNRQIDQTLQQVQTSQPWQQAYNQTNNQAFQQAMQTHQMWQWQQGETSRMQAFFQADRAFMAKQTQQQVEQIKQVNQAHQQARQTYEQAQKTCQATLQAYEQAKQTHNQTEQTHNQTKQQTVQGLQILDKLIIEWRNAFTQAEKFGLKTFEYNEQILLYDQTQKELLIAAQKLNEDKEMKDQEINDVMNIISKQEKVMNALMQVVEICKQENQKAFDQLKKHSLCIIVKHLCLVDFRKGYETAPNKAEFISILFDNKTLPDLKGLMLKENFLKKLQQRFDYTRQKAIIANEAHELLEQVQFVTQEHLPDLQEKVAILSDMLNKTEQSQN